MRVHYSRDYLLSSGYPVANGFCGKMAQGTEKGISMEYLESVLEERRSARLRSPVDYNDLNTVGRTDGKDKAAESKKKPETKTEKKEKKEKPAKTPSGDLGALGGLPSDTKSGQVKDGRDYPVKDLAAEFLTSGGVSNSKRSSESEGKMDTASEKEALRRELEELDRKAERLREAKELEVMRREVEERKQVVAELEDSVKDLGKRPKGKASRAKHSKSVSGGATAQPEGSRAKGDTGGKPFDINDLRGMSDLREMVRHELGKLGLGNKTSGQVSNSEESDSESDSEESDAESDVEDNSSHRKEKKQHSKAKKSVRKSGIESKVSDKVINQQQYPQAHLRFDFVNKGLEFNRLDVNLFVAGELEIISACKDKHERSGRIEFLKRLMYLLSSYDINAVRALYAAVLHEIEIGKMVWGDDVQFVESKVMPRYRLKFRSSVGAGGDVKPKVAQDEISEPIWFCAKYQRNKCAHKGSHTLIVKGKMKYAKHICATCWQNDHKKLEHPECSSACPHTAA